MSNQPPKFDPSDFTLEPRSQRVEKPWGYEVLLSPPDAPYTSKLIHVRAGQRLSLQVHDTKIETQTQVAKALDLADALLRVADHETVAGDRLELIDSGAVLAADERMLPGPAAVLVAVIHQQMPLGQFERPGLCLGNHDFARERARHVV